MKVLHVEAGKHYYGGARQVAYIVEGLARRGVTNVLACPPGAGIAGACAGHAQVVEMKMGGDADAGRDRRHDLEAPRRSFLYPR